MNEGKYIFCNGGILIIRDRTPYYDLLFAVIGSNSLKTTISSLQNLEELVDEILETLTEREQKIIKKRFGLVSGQGCSFREIGSLLGLEIEEVQ